MSKPIAPWRPAALVQRLFEGHIIAKRVDENGDREFLFRWIGVDGDVHEVWYPHTVIKFGDIGD